MTIRSMLVSVLDRPGGRALLGRIANSYAFRLNGGPVMRVFYDRSIRAWGRRALGETIIDGHRFRYYANDLTLDHGITPWSATVQRLWFHRFEPARGDTILDIGAEVGSEVPAFARAVGPDGLVLAIEAHPNTYRLLERTVAYSRLPQVKCIQAAITKERGEMFIEDASNTLSSTVSAHGAGYRVPGLSVDDVCNTYGVKRVALLKMNIEGSERDALQGMGRTLEKTDNLCIACHDFRADRGEGEFFRTRSFVVATLRSAGFNVDAPAMDAPPHIRDIVYAYRLPSQRARKTEVHTSRELEVTH